MNKKNKNSKGFTLIELLVVVAIIGILAAVGVVAYSGYTSSAKKSGAKSNHATVLKYVAAELQKCNIGEDNAMKNKDGADQLDCSKRTTADAVSTAATAALSEFNCIKDMVCSSMVFQEYTGEYFGQFVNVFCSGLLCI